MILPDIGDILGAMTKRGFAVFDGTYDLNLIALRKIPGTTDAFDDLLCCFYRDERGTLIYLGWTCTTDPGKPGIRNPKRQAGCAVIIPGQHRAAYTFGLHHGQYECLVPAKAIPVWRDGNKDDVVDYGGDLDTSATVQIHRANPTRPSTVVGAWSEGCIVIADPNHFAFLMRVAHLQVDHHHGNRFTLTVLEWPT